MTDAKWVIRVISIEAGCEVLPREFAVETLVRVFNLFKNWSNHRAGVRLNDPCHSIMRVQKSGGNAAWKYY